MNPRESYLRNELLGDAPTSERTDSWGEVGGDSSVGTGEERVQAQQEYMKGARQFSPNFKPRIRSFPEG